MADEELQRHPARNEQNGIFADYRSGFWRLARQAHRSGQLDTLLGVGLVSYHLIEFSREALRGKQNAAFYSTRSRQDPIQSAR
jgi:hypothetical protein